MYPESYSPIWAFIFSKSDLGEAFFIDFVFGLKMGINIKTTKIMKSNTLVPNKISISAMMEKNERGI